MVTNLTKRFKLILGVSIIFGMMSSLSIAQQFQPPANQPAKKAAPVKKAKKAPAPEPDNKGAENAKEIEALKKSQEELLKTVADLQEQVLNSVPKLSDEQKAEQAKLLKELEELNKKNEDLDKAIQNGLDPDLVAASKNDLTSKIAQKNAELNAIKPEVANKAVDDLNSEVATLESDVDKANKLAEAADKKADEANSLIKNDFKIHGPGDSYIKVGGLLQTWFISTQDADDKESWDGEFYLRRMRIMVYGQINKYVNFFIETDNPNFGKNGDWSGNMFIQDAYLELNLHKAIQLDAGMLLAPFSHHGMQAATSLMSLDYHGAAVLKYPAGSNKVWRDNGIMARGLVANDHLEYRLGIFNGVRGAGDTDPRNPDDLPRVTGRITANIFEAEGGPGVGGMFYDSMYIKKTDAGVVSTKKVLSIGASFDWQPDLNVYLNSDGTTASTKDYAAVNTDVFWTLPFKDKTMSVDGQVNFYYYYFGDRGNASNRYNVIGDTKSYTGYGIMSELGLRIKAVQPLIIIDGYNSTEAMTDTEGDYLAVYGGFNYYMLGNSTTFKLQVGSAKINDGDWKATATLQAQLVF